MPLRLNDEHCLRWIKDPSISPFKYKKDILHQEKSKNPLSFLERVKWKCFHKSALREEIVKRITEWRQNNTLRLYEYDDFEYTDPPFTIEECEAWVKNHLVNPREQEQELDIRDPVYMELLYTALQYGINVDTLANNEEIAKIIKKVKARLQYMKEIDTLFLTHNIASFDEKLKIAPAPSAPSGRKTAKAKSQSNSYDVSSSSSSKQLKPPQMRQLRDLILEEEKLLELQPRIKPPRVKKEVDRTIFDKFRKFLKDLLKQMKGMLSDILSNATEQDISDILNRFQEFITRDDIDVDESYSTIKGIIYNFMNNMFVYMINPDKKPYELSIGYLSYIVHATYPFNKSDLINAMRNKLLSFIIRYPRLAENLRIRTYFENIVEDRIPFDFVSKRQQDLRDKIFGYDYKNYYYLCIINKKESHELRLPKGGGLLIGKELTKKITDLQNPYFNTDIEDRVLTEGDNPLNGFTYKECEDWAILPIVHPRTFTPILIDSPIYNRLLCMSFQYDMNLIPRMITSRGYKIRRALFDVLETIINGGKAQTRAELEKSIIDKEKICKEKRDNKPIGVSKGVSGVSKGVLLGKRSANFSVRRFYTVVECMRWARQPNIDPKDPTIGLITDSKEYNDIFEQALLYNITPLDITSEGLKFKNFIINKIKPKYLTTVRKPPCKDVCDVCDVKSDVCEAIKKIYEADEKYKRFRDKMLLRCEQPVELNEEELNKLKKEIKLSFILSVVYPSVPTKTLKYYEDSALASLLIAYEPMKGKIYNKEHANFFLTDYKTFNVGIYAIDDKFNEYKREAVGDGTKREFFMKLFDELFCDDEHPKRPFILPEDNIANRYYINPNFEPDEKFRKVIQYINSESKKGKSHKPIPTFDTEADYIYIYEVIGKLLCIAVVNEDIGLPRQFSSYILAGFMKKKIDHYDILYYYLQEFNNAISWINWISTAMISDVDNYGLEYNSHYNISRTSQDLTTANYILFILKLANHVITKNFLGNNVPSSSKNMKKRYDSLFAGFGNVIELGNFLGEKQVSIKTLSLLITNEELTVEVLREFARKITLNCETADVNIKNAMKDYVSNIITNPNNKYGTHKEHLKFIKKLLQFWTSLNYYNKKIPYQIIFKYGIDKSVYSRFPQARTCFYQLILHGFPPTLADEDRERYIYDKLKAAVEIQVMDIT